MYKVVSTILSIPYSSRGYRYKEPNDIEWFKRDEFSGKLKGFSENEAAELSSFLERSCKNNFSKNIIIPTDELEIPHGNQGYTPEHLLPIIYPFEDILNFIDFNGSPFSYEIIGYNRFLERK